MNEWVLLFLVGTSVTVKAWCWCSRGTCAVGLRVLVSVVLRRGFQAMRHRVGRMRSVGVEEALATGRSHRLWLVEPFEHSCCLTGRMIRIQKSNQTINSPWWSKKCRQLDDDDADAVVCSDSFLVTGTTASTPQLGTDWVPFLADCVAGSSNSGTPEGPQFWCCVVASDFYTHSLLLL